MSDPIHIDNPAIKPEVRLIRQEIAAEARQVASEDSFDAYCQEVVNPWAADKDMKSRFKSLSERRTDLKEVQKEEKIEAIESSEESAKRFHEKNEELDQQKLLRLLRSLVASDSIDDVLKKVENGFEDAYLQDEALQFLEANTTADLKETVKNAREELGKSSNTLIVAGRNIKQQTKMFSEKGIGSPPALRELYRNITEEPRETEVLFEQLSKDYSFDKLKMVIQFLLHSFGSDLRSKGPSISRAELARLFTETRSLQTILGVYRFFQSRMNLVEQLFANAQLNVPKMLTFENLAKLFMKLLQERFPNAIKVLSQANQLESEEEIQGTLIIISQWRDAVRNVSPRLYKSGKQRDDLLNAIIEALEELEEQEEERLKKMMEEEEEEEERKRKIKDRKKQDKQ